MAVIQAAVAIEYDHRVERAPVAMLRVQPVEQLTKSLRVHAERRVRSASEQARSADRPGETDVLGVHRADCGVPTDRFVHVATDGEYRPERHRRVQTRAPAIVNAPEPISATTLHSALACSPRPPMRCQGWTDTTSPGWSAIGDVDAVEEVGRRIDIGIDEQQRRRRCRLRPLPSTRSACRASRHGVRAPRRPSRRRARATDAVASLE